MNIELIYTNLDTKIDQFSLDSMREIKSIHDTLHLMHDFMRKVIHFFTLLFYMLITLINLV